MKTDVLPDRAGLAVENHRNVVHLSYRGGYLLRFHFFFFFFLSFAFFFPGGSGWLSVFWQACIYMDEAHSIDALRKTSRDTSEYCGVDRKDVDITMGTFAKAFGGTGGYIAGGCRTQR